MSTLVASEETRDAGPLYRSMVIVDLEGSTWRNNPAKGELRRILYELLDRALDAAGITAGDLEPVADRGDGMLILIKPHDDVPKTVLFSLLMPTLIALLVEYNNSISQSALRIRLRAVIHAGEVHNDGKGFYGEDLDVAFRLLNAPRVKTALREAPEVPLVLVVSEAIFTAIVRHRYIEAGRYEPLVRVRVAERQHKGWVHLPTPYVSECVAAIRRPEGRLLIPLRNGAPTKALHHDERESRVSA
jgi:hypothetical protein